MEVKSSAGILIDDARGEMAGRGNAAPQRPEERTEDRRVARKRIRQQPSHQQLEHVPTIW